MKKILYLTAITVIFLLSSCNDWLDVQPSEQTSADELFSDAEGFRNALNGIYSEASQSTLYGQSLSWGFTSLIAQDYSLSKLTGVNHNIASYRFSDDVSTLSIISSIWSVSYNIIANCNLLLQRIEDFDELSFRYGKTEKDMIKGEVQAMRAMLHFDLLRLFGSIPKDADWETKAIIPYVTIYPNHYTAPQTSKEVLNNIIKDLTEAADLVAPNDTIENPSKLLSNSIDTRFRLGFGLSVDLFMGNRGNRMNYIAIEALLARVYLYGGDIQNAYDKSKFLYGYGAHGNRNWTFTSSSNSKGTNQYIKFADDIIFAFYNPTIMSRMQNFVLSADHSTWYTSLRDYRKELINLEVRSAKWTETSSDKSESKLQNYLIPVIRMSEMYYIYSECLYKLGEHEQAITVLNNIRTSRGRTDKIVHTSEEDFYNELLLEYRREFIAEGQTFFYYKRQKQDIIILNPQATYKMDDNMILAVPDNETIF